MFFQSILAKKKKNNINREFDVPSLNFTGQVHRWRLSQLLQKGFLRTQESLLRDLALASRFIVVTALTRISGHFFSIVESARALLRGCLLLIDMIVGIPSLLAHNLDYKIKEERCRYLIAELICRVRISLSLWDYKYLRGFANAISNFCFFSI